SRQADGACGPAQLHQRQDLLRAGARAVDACLRSLGREIPARVNSMRRAHDIRRILDARFSLSGLDEWKQKDPAWWISASNDMGRGLYEQAMREAHRLESVS